MNPPDTDRASELDLAQVGWYTEVITTLLSHKRDVVTRRREAIMRLRAADFTYEAIAAAMGTSTQAVYKAIKSELPSQREPNLDT